MDLEGFSQEVGSLVIPVAAARRPPVAGEGGEEPPPPPTASDLQRPCVWTDTAPDGAPTALRLGGWRLDVPFVQALTRTLTEGGDTVTALHLWNAGLDVS